MDSHGFPWTSMDFNTKTAEYRATGRHRSSRDAHFVANCAALQNLSILMPTGEFDAESYKLKQKRPQLEPQGVPEALEMFIL